MSRAFLTALLPVLAFAASGPVLARPVAVVDAPDPWITMKTKMALLTEIGTDALDVNVDTIDGQVTLHGKLESEEARELASRVTTSIDGVGGVRNLVQVVAPSVEKAVEISDEQLEERVKAALESGKVKDIQLASVNGGVVLLEGKVERLSDVLASMRLAAAVPGVQRVASQVELDESGGLLDDELARAEQVAENTGEAVRDAWLTTEVKLKLMAEKGVPALDINVDTNDGAVTLFGSVPDEQARAAALAVARGVGGVREVRDALIVDAEALADTTPDAPPPPDADIAAAIRERFAERSILLGGAADAIDVDVEGGVVRLSGTVPRQADRLQAATIARSIDGVVAVDNELRIVAHG